MIADSEKAWTLESERIRLLGLINIEDRTNLVGFGPLPIAPIRLLGNSGSKEADGKSFFRDGAGSRANIYVNVSGAIRDTYRVFLDLDRDGKTGAGEGLDITNGVASKSFRPRQLTAGGTVGGRVNYAPGGETDLKPGTFNTKISSEYDDDSLVDHDAR